MGRAQDGPSDLIDFAHFACVDWSGAVGERQKGIAVAICEPGTAAPRLVGPEWRWSRHDVLEWLKNAMPPATLVGIDLSPALPFADLGAYFPEWDASPPDAKSLWRFVDDIAADDPHLASTSFVRHPEARRHFRHGRGDTGDLFAPGKGRLRETERRQASQRMNPSSCFNLVGAAQVGKSSLTGMRLLHRLDGAVPVWPFDDTRDGGSLIVEIYTSIAAREAGIAPGRSKMLEGEALDAALGKLGVEAHAALDRYTDHATDAILTAAWLRRAASDEALWRPPGLNAVRMTEGWTFGVR